MTFKRFYLVSILLFGFGAELAATLMLGPETGYDRVVVDPDAQSSGIKVFKRAPPLFSSDPISNPYERHESQEIVVIENRKNGQRIEFKFNDRNFYFEQEKDDFAHTAPPPVLARFSK